MGVARGGVFAADTAAAGVAGAGAAGFAGAGVEAPGGGVAEVTGPGVAAGGVEVGAPGFEALATGVAGLGEPGAGVAAAGVVVPGAAAAGVAGLVGSGVCVVPESAARSERRRVVEPKRAATAMVALVCFFKKGIIGMLLGESGWGRIRWVSVLGGALTIDH
jgi:hypothetical protein